MAGFLIFNKKTPIFIVGWSVKFSQEYSGFERIPMSSGGAKYVAKHFEFSSQIQKLADAIASFNPNISLDITV
ncbi:hypothetical protein ACL9RF_12055 [Sphingobacterium sp. Mn56C]|uniref:hypothetical protein n=1 Tax=Sphingobacterium sp. Mn56C TaxID=3395261 RepID=UPI003BD4E3EB